MLVVEREEFVLIRREPEKVRGLFGPVTGRRSRWRSGCRPRARQFGIGVEASSRTEYQPENLSR